MIATPAQKVFFVFKPSRQFAAVERLDRFDVDVVQKPFFMLLSEVSSFIRNHLHLKVLMEVSVSDIPRCNNDVPNCLVLKSLHLDARFPSFAIKITPLPVIIILFKIFLSTVSVSVWGATTQPSGLSRLIFSRSPTIRHTR